MVCSPALLTLVRQATRGGGGGIVGGTVACGTRWLDCNKDHVDFCEVLLLCSVYFNGSGLLYASQAVGEAFPKACAGQRELLGRCGQLQIT